MAIGEHAFDSRIQKLGAIPETKTLKSIQSLIETGNRAIFSSWERDITEFGGLSGRRERPMSLDFVPASTPGDHCQHQASLLRQPLERSVGASTLVLLPGQR